MWSYYGSKCKIAKLYPKPEYGLIIEPFAGSAWYSVLHRDRRVILNEKDTTIYGIWEWLLKEATSKLILDNADFYEQQDIRQLHLGEPHKNLLGFCINRGSVSPTNIVQKWNCQVKNNPNWASTTNYQLTRIAKLLPDIKHWDIRLGDYKQLPNIEATWFIDPPYQFGGSLYKENYIDYPELAEWCQSRKGQVIVCENTKSDWLDFKPLVPINGQKRKTIEAVYYNK